jgi:hypothetical protein
MRPRHRRQQSLRLHRRQHHRQPRRSRRSLNVPQIPQLHLQHLSVKKHQGIQRLILSGHRHLLSRSQITQETLHLRRPQLARMPLAVKENKPLDPLAVSLFRAQGIMFKPHHLAHLIQQFQFRIGAKPFPNH